MVFNQHFYYKPKNRYNLLSLIFGPVSLSSTRCCSPCQIASFACENLKDRQTEIGASSGHRRSLLMPKSVMVKEKTASLFPLFLPCSKYSTMV